MTTPATTPPSTQPGSDAATAGPGAQAISALQRLLGTEHAAVFAYSVIGVHLDDPGQITRARDLQEAHRIARDDIAGQLAAREVTPDPPAATYSPAEPVTDAPSAQRWALQIEQDCAAAYRFQLSVSATGSGGASVRPAALAGLTEAAQQARYWRQFLTPATPTVAFPGVG